VVDDSGYRRVRSRGRHTVRSSVGAWLQSGGQSACPLVCASVYVWVARKAWIDILVVVLGATAHVARSRLIVLLGDW
jgi:hypothetical protein